MKDKEKQTNRTDNFEELSDTVSIPDKEKTISISKFEDIKLTIPFKKEIEEMAKILREECFYDLREVNIETSERLATKLLEHYQPKLPEHSVVLSKEEVERLSSSHDIVFCDNKDCPDNLLCRCCEISECPKNIPEYNEKLSANKHKLELFQKLCKERERADSWEDRYKLLEEEFKQECKEIAERFFAELFYVASIHHSDVANILAWAKDKATKLGINIKGI